MFPSFSLVILLICGCRGEQPSEMSLEEIESRVGSLMQAETISQLKSAAWKERLEGSKCFFSPEII